ncbi:MAG: hypothetical protein QOI64_2571 [Solirubrobacteraceae bacterium]|nr:hypothetical protein [Solirubrobacteraceae bacterium]
MRSKAEYDAVIGLCATGKSDYEIARLTGVPRSTVQKWRRSKPKRSRERDFTGWRPPDGETYCYVLGLYLGDGHIVHRNGRAGHMRLYLDDAYPRLIAEASAALHLTLAPARVRTYNWGREARTILQICNPVILAAFPQHGPGKKHDRKIELVDWQRELTHAHPAALVRGLIHSDGCRTVNRFKTKLPSGRVAEYAYPRYFFSNLSADIRAIFCEHCELLGVGWTQSNSRNISVSHRTSVAILEDVVGPKR